VLVLLPVEDSHNREVIRAAVAGANGRPLVFLSLGRRQRQPVELMAFADPYLTDRAAQRILSAARNAADREKVPAYFVYRVGGAQSVSDVWRIIHPDELIAGIESARTYARAIAPEYVRRQVTHDVTIEHRVRRHHVVLDGTSSGPPQIPTMTPAPTPGPNGRAPISPRSETLEASAQGKAQATPNTSSEDWIWTGTDLVRRPHDDESSGGEEEP
jgi:hypothetical protein